MNWNKEHLVIYQLLIRGTFGKIHQMTWTFGNLQCHQMWYTFGDKYATFGINFNKLPNNYQKHQKTMTFDDKITKFLQNPSV